MLMNGLYFATLSPSAHTTQEIFTFPELIFHISTLLLLLIYQTPKSNEQHGFYENHKAKKKTILQV